MMDEFQLVGEMERELDVDVARLVSCEYDHNIVETPKKEGKQLVIVYFLGGITYMEIAALRFLAKKVRNEMIVDGIGRFSLWVADRDNKYYQWRPYSRRIGSYWTDETSPSWPTSRL